MIFDEIILHNFGVYLGRQKLSLTPPSPSQPLILLGGLNGAGKTTILDALQIALYGKLAHCSSRGNLSYEDFLYRSVHHAIHPPDGAALEIQFRQTSEGETHIYRLHRSWAAYGHGLHEKFEVICDGKLDNVLTEGWNERVEEFIPSRISHLFFFDGEEIEKLANPDNSALLLSTAIHSLLGLDIVERLADDLVVLERRNRKDLSNAIDQAHAETLEAAIRHAEEELADCRMKCASTQNEVDLKAKYLRNIEDRLKQEGGDLFERRKELEAEQSTFKAQLYEIEEELRDFAEGPAPLLLVQDILLRIEKQNQREKSYRDAMALKEILFDRDAQLLREVSNSGAAKKLITLISDFLSKDRGRRSNNISGDLYLHISNESQNQLQYLLTSIAEEAATKACKLLEVVDGISLKRDDTDRALGGIPDEAAITGLIKGRQDAHRALEEAQHQLREMDINCERIGRELDQKRAALTRHLEKSVETKLEQEDSWRIVHYSEKARRTLNRFRSAIVEKHAGRIQQLMLDSFRLLLRKESLISDLKIDPEHFTIKMRGADGCVLSPEQLSAGERQLLAVSMLWGLGRASGRPLPTIIDTPLGRLDSSHRTHMVERYFPHASHQVLLLSTDEEINATYYEKLKPWIGRAYRLEFNDQMRATTINPGYFW